MPANPMRGEADFGGHKLIVDFNRLCTLEGAMDRDVFTLIAMADSGLNFGFRDLRTFIRVFLDKQMTDEEVGDLISSVGMVEVEVPPAPGSKKKAQKVQTWAASVALTKALAGFRPGVEEEPGERPLRAA